MNQPTMKTAPQHAEVFAANRAFGEIALTVAAGPQGSRRRRVHEAGSLRVRFPNGSGAALEAVVANVAGGMAGGDRYKIEIRLDEGAAVRLTTAAAEKIYRSLGADTEIDVTLEIGRGGSLFWLPQETILFNGSRLERCIDVDLATGADLLMAESIVFGRSAMGETVASGFFSDRWRVRLDGRLVFADSTRLHGDVAQRLTERAVAGGAAAVATILKIPGDEQTLAAVRGMQQEFAAEIGASAWNGFMTVRCVAAHAAMLRHDLGKILSVLSSGPLPRLWSN
jgi:urease accessory protein